MLQNTVAASFIIALACSCASAPAKPAAPLPSTPKPATAAAAPAPEMPTAQAAASALENHNKLAPGRCEESFDCVDTIGFPPAGQRWTCVDGKCGHAKLPDLNTDASPANAEAGVDNSKIKPKARASKRQHN